METVIIDAPVLPRMLDREAFLAVQNNPFESDDVTKMVIPVGVKVSEALKDIAYDIELYDIVVYRNNELVDVEIVVEEYDVVTVTFAPKGSGGGGLLAMVAMVALSFAAPALAGAMMPYLGYGAGTVLAVGGIPTMAGIVSMGLTAGIMIAGSMLISTLFTPSMPTGNSGSALETSQTYGWDTAGTSMEPGGAVPILYGKFPLSGTFINKYVVTKDNTQTLKMQVALCEGRVDEITNFSINDEPYDNFTDVSFMTRKGYSTQTVMTGYTEVYTSTSVGKNLDTENWSEYVTAMTSGDQVQKVSLGILAPRGLYTMNDKGEIKSNTIQLDIEYRKVTIPEAAWSQLSTGSNFKCAEYMYVCESCTGYSYETVGKSPTGNKMYYPPESGGTFTIYYRECGSIGGYSNMGTTTTLPFDRDDAELKLWQTYSTGNQRYGYYIKSTAATSLPYISIQSDTTSPFRKTIDITGLPKGQYEVRMRYYSAPITDTKHGSDITLEYIQEAILDDFSYPHTALLAVSIEATDQIAGGLPKLSCEVTRVTVIASDNGWANVASQWGLTLSTIRLDNPAWATLDLMINSRYGAGISLDRIDKEAFVAWADYCGELLLNGSPRFTCNIVLDTLMSLNDAMNLLGQLGHARVVQFGSTFSVIVDMPNILPSQGFLFSMGNIIQSSFSETFLPLKDRANIIEVTYYDSTNAYQRTSIEVAHGNYDLVAQVNKQTINLIGCVTRNQAIRQAYYHLNQNRFLTITASWEASIDSIHCKVGDIVNVAHDVPQWGYSGRIVSNTSNTITVDRDDLEMGLWKTYYIQVSDANTDTQVYKQVSSVAGNVLTLVDNDLTTLGAYSVYSFGEVDRHAKQFRILSINTAGDLKRKISAIEYYPEVYSDALVTDPDVDYSDLSTRNINITEYLEIAKDGTIKPVVDVSWDGARISYKVEYKKVTDRIFTSYATVRTTSAQIRGLVEGIAYHIRIDGKVVIHQVVGKIAPPPDVTGLVGTESGNVFTLSWDYNEKPLDFKRFLVYKGTTLLGATTSNSFVTAVIPGSGDVTLTVVSEDTTQNKSSGVNVVIPVSPVPIVSSLSGSISGGRLTLDWAYSPPVDFSHFNIYDGTKCIGNATDYTFTATAKNYTTDTHTYYVEAVDIVGNKSTKVPVVVNIVKPSVGAINVTFTGDKVNLDWPETTGSYKIAKYEVTVDTNVSYSTVSQITLNYTWLGAKTVSVKAIDTAGATTTMATIVTIKAPKAPVVTYTIVKQRVVFRITQAQETYSIVQLEISYDGGTVTAPSGTPTYEYNINWNGSKDFTFTSIDARGNRSTSTLTSVSVAAATVTNVSSSVIDNNVLLKWQYSEGTLPIEHFDIRKGATFGSSVSLGIRKGSFTTIFEDKSGTYTYWVVPYDTAGVIGTYAPVIASVSEPPDFVLNGEFTSNWSGTATNTLIENGKGILPIKLTETYSQHFTANSWSTVQNQIDAGYPLWLTPNNTTATYTQIFDTEATLGSTAITLTDPQIVTHGTGVYTMTRTIWTSADNITYTAQPTDVLKVYVANIRYVKIVYSWTVEADCLLEVGNFNVRLDQKLKNDAGIGSVTTASTGAVVNFNKTFVDITSITVTPSGTTPAFAIYDFVDAPNPTSFTVYLYNTSGTRITGSFSWSAKGY